jgi:crotonobetainyl-CoA:carnitine CoA-transferase CaiB-like acyl-CoA transferase
MKNLKVVELASVLAGPAVGMFFAELGAEVIKIENKTTGGDVTRSWKLPSEKPDAEGSAYFYSVNYHKQYLMLDLQAETDRDTVYDLLRGCDVVISNFKKSSAVKLGMDYETVKKLNPTVIYGQIYGYDEEDETPAFDVVLQAEAGFMFMTGERGRGAVKMPVALIDLLAAHQLKEGLLLALWERERTGKGAFVSTSLYEAAVASLANQATNWLMAGQIPQRIGSEHPNIAPYGDVFITVDSKEMVLACGTEKQWQSLCKILKTNDLMADKRFKTNGLRVKNRAKLNKILRGCIKEYERAILLNLLKNGQVPAGAIRDMREIFEDDRAKNMVLEEKGLQDYKVAGLQGYETTRFEGDDEEHLAERGVTKRVKTVAFKII